MTARCDRQSSPARRRGRDRAPGRPNRRTSRHRRLRGRTTCPPWRRRSRSTGCPCGPSAIRCQRGNSACPEAPRRAPARARADRRRRPASPARSSSSSRDAPTHAVRPEGRGSGAKGVAEGGEHGRREPECGLRCPRFCRPSDGSRDVGTGPLGRAPPRRTGWTPSDKSLKQNQIMGGPQGGLRAALMPAPSHVAELG